MHFMQHATPGEPAKSAEELRAEIAADDMGDGWVGDSAEREWAAAMAHAIKEKMRKATASGFVRYDKNWLLLYDNWPVPMLDIQKATGYLLTILASENPFSVFDAIAVIDDKTLCLLGQSCAGFFPIPRSNS